MLKEFCMESQQLNYLSFRLERCHSGEGNLLFFQRTVQVPAHNCLYLQFQGIGPSWHTQTQATTHNTHTNESKLNEKNVNQHSGLDCGSFQGLCYSLPNSML